MLEQILAAKISLVGKLFVIGCFQISIESIGDIRALHLQQQLPPLHVVVEPSPDIDDAAVRHRDDGNLAGDVGKYRARGFQHAGQFNPLGCDELKFSYIVAVDRDQVHVGYRDDMGRRRSAISFRFAFAAGRNQDQRCRNSAGQ